MTAEAAHLLGLHVGESVPYGLFTNEQISLPGMGTPSVQPHRRIDAKLVGLVALNRESVADAVARAIGRFFERRKNGGAAKPPATVTPAPADSSRTPAHSQS